MHLRASLFGLMAAALLCGCSSIGPARVEQDRIEYNTSITESWKRQILLNMVKIRYVEPMFFMEVGEVVTSYSMQTGGTLSGSRTLYDLMDTSDLTVLGLEGTAMYTDRPTITYRPLTGNAFFRGVMLPIPLQNVLACMESGVSAKFVLSMGVRSINGHRNETLSESGFRAAAPEFRRVVDLLGRLQAENALHIVKEPVSDAHPPRLHLLLTNPKDDHNIAELQGQLRSVLGLKPDTRDYLLGFGSAYAGDDAVMIQTLSLAQMLASLSRRIEMPEGHVDTHRAVNGRQENEEEGFFDHCAVHSSKTKPGDAFAAVKYRSHWFWVDDHDLETKRVFTFIMLAFTLMDKAVQDTQLQLTVPTQ